MTEDVKEARNVVQEDAICGGVPILEGTRIRVSDVVAQVEYQEKTPEEVVSSFPALSVSDVYAALTYYYERPSQIRKEIRERESLYSIEGSQAKMSTARRLQGARSRRCGASSMQRNIGGGVQGHLQRPERSEEVLLGCPSVSV